MKNVQSLGQRAGTGLVARLSMALAAGGAILLSSAAPSRAADDAFGEIDIPVELNLMTQIPSAFNGADVGAIIGADRFYDMGITGQNAIVANVEAGHIWNGHETLTHVSEYAHDASTYGTSTSDLYDRHATAVGSVIAGRLGGTTQGIWQTGIAYGADLKSGAVASYWTGTAYSTSFGISSTTLDTAYGHYFGSADVINSSWGGTDSAGTTIYTLLPDALAFENPTTTLVLSAGNDGPSSNTVGGPGSGYNAITVGALQNDGSNNYDAVTGFSSRGPSDYYDPDTGTVTGMRATVDLVAPGTDLTTAYYGGATGGNSGASGGTTDPNYYLVGVAGTSFAAPVVAGGATLLHSYAREASGFTGGAAAHDARVIKATLMNSATKLAGWNNGLSDLGPSIPLTTIQGLDWSMGAGALNLDAAMDQFAAGTTDVAGLASGNLGLVETIGWDLGSVIESADNRYELDTPLPGEAIITATLTWFRNRDYTGPGTAADLAFSDLDLYVYDLDTSEVIAQSISTYNSTEHLYFTLGSDRRIGLGVNFIGELFGTESAVTYALAWSASPVPEPQLAGVLVLSITLLVRRRRAMAA